MSVWKLRQILRHPIGQTRGRFNTWVVRTLFPQRPFITFGPGATMTNVSIREVNGRIVIEGYSAQIRNVNVYDGRFVLAGVDSLIEDGLVHARRPMNGESAVEIPMPVSVEGG